MSEPNPEYRRQLARLIGLDQLRCLNCRYDLRGQEGEERRCPECGSVSRLKDMVAYSIARGEVDPRIEGIASLAAIPMFVFAVSVVVPFLPGASRLTIVSFFLASILIWIIVGAVFGQSVRFRRGWPGAYAMYSITALAFIVLIVGCVAIVFVALYRFNEAQSAYEYIKAGLVAISGIILAVIVSRMFQSRWSPTHLAQARMIRIQFLMQAMSNNKTADVDKKSDSTIIQPPQSE